MSKPMISVVMPVYNAELYLSDAIESILNQTYTNFEFIMINDGSTDGSLEIIERYKHQDERIILISRKNQGLVSSLNEGISQAKGEYIARMDADDISMPERFKEQIDFIKEKNLDICGTNIMLFKKRKDIGVQIYPQEDRNIKFTLMFMSAFAHPTVIFKKEIFKSLNYEHYKHAEDYKLWVDIALMSFNMGNLNKVLLRYRVHDEQISKINALEQRVNTHKISQYYLLNNSESKAMAELMDDIKENASVKILDKIYSDIASYSKKHQISDDILINVYRHIFRQCSTTNIKFFIVYKKYTKIIFRDFQGDFYLFIQSLFLLNRESKMYNILKRFV